MDVGRVWKLDDQTKSPRILRWEGMLQSLANFRITDLNEFLGREEDKSC